MTNRLPSWAIGALASVLFLVFAGIVPPAASAWVSTAGVQPLDNNGSGGSVVLTWDDGPGIYTANLLAMLKALHLHVVFYNLGDKMQANPGLTRDEYLDGDVVANHSYNLPNFTQISASQVRQQLTETENIIAADGVPKPTIWKPPFGAFSNPDQQIGNSLGLSLNPFEGYNGCLDSRDWNATTGVSTAAIVSNITKGYSFQGYEPPLHAGDLVTFHDGSGDRQLSTEPNMIRALPAIVRYMNTHHLSASTDANDTTCTKNADIDYSLWLHHDGYAPSTLSTFPSSDTP
jgi:peptidoglycan/xylan/chitin deacetylase (PgdA/CDA1 family)